MHEGNIKEDHYDSKYKNKRRSGDSRHSPRHVGNSLGAGRGRPSLRSSNRLEQSRINDETAKHIIVDSLVSAEGPLYRKSSAQTMVTLLDEVKINPQKPQKASVPMGTGTDAKRLPPRYIHLPDIHPRLYVANLNFILQGCYKSFHKTERGVLINVSSDHLVAGTDSLKVYNITFHDSPKVRYVEFVKIIERAFEIINEYQESLGNIYLVCDKGVNRSVALAMAYAIVHNGSTFINARDYIEKAKNATSLVNGMWDSLTNSRLNTILVNLAIQTRKEPTVPHFPL
jgi:hypothetical protein